MIARLRILHGTLQDKKGQSKHAEVKISGPRFVVGSASDCSMCCRCNTVSPYHCEIRIEEQCVVVRALSHERGTFVNDLLVEDERVLRTGDHLRIGRLEFEVAIGESTPGPSPERTADGTSASDAVAEELCDILDEADERARLLRLEHPEWRQLHLELAATDAAKTPASAAEAQSHSAQGTGATKVKTAPGKLPARPPTADSQGKDSSEAAQQALRKLFSR